MPGPALECAESRDGADRMGDELAFPWSAALVRRLLARGLDPNRPDWLGKTFLHACAARGDPSIAAVFLEARADINARRLAFNQTPPAPAPPPPLRHPRHHLT